MTFDILPFMLESYPFTGGNEVTESIVRGAEANLREILKTRLPNVGKSTLFNDLLKRQQAYVANFPDKIN